MHRIRRIEDDAYVFSIARGFPGRIIACRTKDGRDFCGKSLFDVLKISRSEYEFLNARLCEGGTCALAIATGERVARAVIIFRFFVYDSSLLLAVAPNCDASIISRLAESGELGDTVTSPLLRAVLKESVPKDINADNTICEYMARIYGCVDVLSGLCREKFRPDADDIRFAANAVGMLVGAGVFTEVTYIPEKYAGMGKRIFAGELCVSAMLSFAMIARRYSRGRELLVEVVYDGEDVFLKLSFDVYGEMTGLNELEHLSMIVKGHRELYFDFSEEEGILSLEIWPFYYDVGVGEVKRPDPFMKLRLPRELFSKREKENI